MKRRTFLGCGATLSLLGTQALAADSTSQRRLLVLLLRGGMDGLAAIPPLGDAQLRELRGNLVPPNTLPATDFFGVHPAIPTFARMLSDKEAVAIHAAGFNYRGRSHFEGQDIMQSGVEKPFASPSGWLGRGMQKAKVGTGMAISIPMPLILRGDPSAETEFPTWLAKPRDASLAPIGQRLGGAGAAAPAMSPTASPMEINQQMRSPKSLAHQAGLRMAREDGPMVGLIDFVGFDTHAGQGSAEGLHAERLKMVDDVLSTYKTTMGERWKDTLVLTVTEFGRTAAENGTTGTDHGWGTCILAAGGLVKTSGVVSDWPGLAKAKLFENRDLVATMDAKAVYAEAMRSVFGLSLEQIQDGVLPYKAHPLTKDLFKA
jgi:uncharacterized protein (DUF1501 family)